MQTATAAQAQKALGAFYTDPQVVQFLVDWGLRAGARSVMDPSCGDGRFLDAAAAAGADRLLGCDVSRKAIEETTEQLRHLGSSATTIESDFFSIDPGSVDPLDLVVGNPPFIRYQNFDNQSRDAALASAFRLGIRLSRLTSTWAPFLLHAMQFLKTGGRVAMVVPAEASQTRYGLKTLKALLQYFSTVRLVTFESNFFDDAQAETYLLLADGYGGSSRSVELIPLRTISELVTLTVDVGAGTRQSDGRFDLPLSSFSRFAEAFLSPRERAAWARARRHPRVRTVASLAEATNGYVTGDNDFFHRSRSSAESSGYPATWLLPTARSSRSLSGLYFTREDLETLEAQGPAHHLLFPREDLFSEPEPLARLEAEGAARGTPGRFKCRSRSPWWRVPGLQEADVLVGYMAGAYPRASVNTAHVLYTNSLHGLRMRPGNSPVLLTLALYSSLSLLSLELEGRSYGGGVLKIEPRELDRVILPWPELAPSRIEKLALEVDQLLRSGRYAEASDAVDRCFLIEGLGLSKTTVQHLRNARARLHKRRSERRKRKRA